MQLTEMFCIVTYIMCERGFQGIKYTLGSYKALLLSGKHGGMFCTKEHLRQCKSYPTMDAMRLRVRP